MSGSLICCGSSDCIGFVCRGLIKTEEAINATTAPIVAIPQNQSPLVDLARPNGLATQSLDLAERNKSCNLLIFDFEGVKTNDKVTESSGGRLGISIPTLSS